MRQAELRGIHVFWMVFSFFAVVIAVDAYFIFGAIKTFPGEEVENSYVLGLRHNAEMAELHEQESLGWRMQAGVERRQISVRLTDAQTAPLAGMTVSARYFVAGQGKHETILALEEQAPGSYSAPLNVSGPARIELTVEVRRPEEQEIAFVANKKVSVP